MIKEKREELFESRKEQIEKKYGIKENLEKYYAEYENKHKQAQLLEQLRYKYHYRNKNGIMQWLGDLYRKYFQ